MDTDKIKIYGSRVGGGVGCDDDDDDDNDDDLDDDVDLSSCTASFIFHDWFILYDWSILYQVRVDSMLKVAEIEEAEKDKMRAKCKKIIDHGITCFINRQLIYNFPGELSECRWVSEWV